MIEKDWLVEGIVGESQKRIFKRTGWWKESFILAGIQQSRLEQKSKTVKVVRKFRWLLIEPSGVLGPLPPKQIPINMNKPDQ